MTNSFNLEESRNSWSRTSQTDLDLENVGEKRTSRRGWIIALLISCLVIVGLVTGLVLEATQDKQSSPDETLENQRQDGDQVVNQTTSPSPPPTVHWPRRLGSLSVGDQMHFSLSNKTSWKHDISSLADQEPSECFGSFTSSEQAGICLEWAQNRRLTIQLSKPTDDSNVGCYDIEWSALNCIQQVLTDCFDVSSSHWYGGYEDTHQLWPFERNHMSLSDYLSHDGFRPGIGNVLERYFVSSGGVGISIANDVPLYFSLNRPEQGLMCFTAKYEKYPYFNLNQKLPTLRYTICEGRDVKMTHKAMSARFIPHPIGIPNTDLFRYPIWSTWAQFHREINQSNVLQYAKNIAEYNFTCAQVKIDEKWTPVFGDLDFDTKKFPNATKMIDSIKELGFKVTLWVPPFFENSGQGYKEAEEKGFLVRQFESDHVILTSWWDGNHSGILDVSNNSAVDWFLAKLERLKGKYHVDSFKFDAGESEWLPNMYSMANMSENPSDIYPRKYVEMAAGADSTERRQEVRCGYRSQEHPMFVRQSDKKSQWSGPGSLETIIPGVLTFGLIGYPFVLSDMVGGNAYENFTSAELYIRWMQLNVFLPGLQLSIVPWKFNTTVIDIVRNFVELHTSVSDRLIHFANQSVLTGEPVIRPVWWIDPVNEAALTCGDEFLVGDQYLVAPIISEGARSRDIYVPSGDWLDMLRGNGSWPVIRGPQIINNYTVELEELAYFENVKYRS